MQFIRDILTLRFIERSNPATIDKVYAVFFFILFVVVGFIFYRGMSGDSQWQQDREEWQRQMEIYQQERQPGGWIQFGENKTASESGYIIVITALVTVIGVLTRVIVVLYRDKKETDKVTVGLVEDSITSNKEMTATFQALKPFIRT